MSNASDDEPSIPPQRSLKRRMLTGLFWTTLGRLGSAGSFLVSQIVLGKALSKSDFADYQIAYATMVMLQTLVTMGTPPILARTLRQIHGADIRRDSSRAVRSCFRVVTIAATATVILTSCLAFGASAAGWASTKWSVLTTYPLLISLWAAGSALCLLTAWTLQGLDDFRSATLVGARNGGALANVAFLVLLGVYYQFNHLELQLLFATHAMLQAIALSWGLLAVRTHLRLLPSPSLSPKTGQSTESAPYDARWFFRESLPNLGTRLVDAAFAELDILLVNSFVDKAAIADYGVAKRLVLIVSAPFVMLLPSVGPFVAELLAKGQLARLERIVRGFTTLISIPIVVMLSVALFAPEWTLATVFGSSKYIEAAHILQVLCTARMVYVLSGNNGQTLLMGGRQRELMLCSIGMLAVYASIAPPLMWQRQAFGAAVAIWIVTVLQSIITTIMAKKLVGVWTAASLSPRAFRSALTALLGRRSPDAGPANNLVGDDESHSQSTPYRNT